MPTFAPVDAKTGSMIADPRTVAVALPGGRLAYIQPIKVAAAAARIGDLFPHLPLGLLNTEARAEGDQIGPELARQWVEQKPDAGLRLFAWMVCESVVGLAYPDPNGGALVAGCVRVVEKPTEQCTGAEVPLDAFSDDDGVVLVRAIENVNGWSREVSESEKPFRRQHGSASVARLYFASLALARSAATLAARPDHILTTRDRVPHGETGGVN